MQEAPIDQNRGSCPSQQNLDTQRPKQAIENRGSSTRNTSSNNGSDQPDAYPGSILRRFAYPAPTIEPNAHGDNIGVQKDIIDDIAKGYAEQRPQETGPSSSSSKPLANLVRGPSTYNAWVDKVIGDLKAFQDPGSHTRNILLHVAQTMKAAQGRDSPDRDFVSVHSSIPSDKVEISSANITAIGRQISSDQANITRKPPAQLPNTQARSDPGQGDACVPHANTRQKHEQPNKQKSKRRHSASAQENQDDYVKRRKQSRPPSETTLPEHMRLNTILKVTVNGDKLRAQKQLRLGNCNSTRDLFKMVAGAWHKVGVRDDDCTIEVTRYWKPKEEIGRVEYMEREDESLQALFRVIREDPCWQKGSTGWCLCI